MRRTLSFIAVFLFVVSIACAESNTEILFRNIPWGITLKEYVEELENQGFIASEVGPNELYGSLLGIEHPEYFCAATYENALMQPICKVAGYDVCAISVYAICDIEKERINTDSLDSVVFMSSYSFLTLENQDAVVNDLREKLSYLYGSERTREKGVLRYYWQGQNQTEIELASDGLGFMTTLTYKDNSIDGHLDKLNSIIYKETTNLDGL